MTTTNRFTCPRCTGSGHLPTLRHIDGGVCFKCDGTGKVDHLPAAPVVDDLTAGYVLVRPYAGRFAFVCDCATWAEAMAERAERAGVMIAKRVNNGAATFRDGTEVVWA